jgi:uncharacterized repeat protein (TIGR01451 family)
VITGPADGSTINNPTPPVTGTGEPGATVTVTDGGTPLCAATVQADGSWSCTPSTPIDDGSHTITATQTDPAGNSSPPSDPITVTVDTTPGLSLTKTAAVTDTNEDGIADKGDTVSWTLVATNTGHVDLVELTVDDPSGGSVTCPVTAIAVGQSVTCTVDAAHVVTQADMDAGQVTNTATATASTQLPVAPPPARTLAVVPAARAWPLAAQSGTLVTSNPASVVTELDVEFGLHLTKSGTVVDTNHDGVIDPGDVVEWSITVQNVGTATVSDLVVSDPTAGAVTCASTTLEPGASTTCTVPSHTVTAADAAAGSITNEASGSGNTGGYPTTAPVAAATIDHVQPTPIPAVSAPTAPDAQGPLAFTGLSLLPQWLIAGALLLVVGLGLLGLGRRRREQD